MSVTENNVLIRSKDSSGNSNLYYPITKVDNVDGLDEALATKVDKVTGKGLSTNDYSTAEKNKLAGIAEGANKTTVDSALSSTSTNPVQNKAVNSAISGCVKTSGGTMDNHNSLLAASSNTKNISPNETAVAASPFARDLWHDHFAFLAGGHTIRDHQVTTDGSAWTDSTLDLTSLFMQKESINITILGKTELARRFTIATSNFPYSGIHWYEIGVAYTNPFSQFEVYIETSSDKSSWSGVHKSTITGNSAPFFLKGNDFGGNQYLRFTFTKKTNTTTGTVSISCIKAYTTRKANQGLGIEYEYPYDWNASRDIYPHSDNSRSLGLSNRRWKNIYSTTFTGSLSGNAGSATKLATARTFRTNLGSTSTASFNGTKDVTPGVTGTLPLANGGTGATTAAAGRANLGAAKVYWSEAEPTDWTINDMWLQIID